MLRKYVSLVLILMFSVSQTVAQIEDCPAILANALRRVENACAAMGGNQACYGYQSLDAQLSPGLSQFAFNAVGDITPVDTIQSLRLSALDTDANEWGVAVMRIRADISENQTNHNVTLIAFGGVTLDPDTSGDYQPMQAFTLSTNGNSSGCTDVTENGLLIQTPEGVGRVTLWVNQVKIRIGSTVLFQAQAGGDLLVSTFEGSAQVEVLGEMQDAVAGTTVVVPMDADLLPLAPPSVPQPFDGDATGLATLLNVSQFFTDRTVARHLASETTQSDLPLNDNSQSATLTNPPNGLSPRPLVVETGSDEILSTPSPPNRPHNISEPTVLPSLTPQEDDRPTAVRPTTLPPDIAEDNNNLLSPTSPSPPTSAPEDPTDNNSATVATPAALPPSPPSEGDGEILPPPSTATPDDPGDAGVSDPSAPISLPPTESDGSGTSQDCNNHHANGESNGNCYGHYKERNYP